MQFKHLDRIVFAGDSVATMRSVTPVGEGLFDNLSTSVIAHYEWRGYSQVYLATGLIASVTLFNPQ